MEPLITLSYYLHIGAGTISLLTGPMALFAIKGSKRHMQFGRIFFWSMSLVFVTSMLNGIYKEFHFLTFVGIFSYYNVISGIRALQLLKQRQAQPIDYFIHWLALAAMLGFVYYGFWAWTYNHLVGGLSIGFGIGGLLNVRTYSGMLKRSLKEVPRAAFIQWHIGGLVGGFIASVTAFSAQTLGFLPGVAQWLWPTAVFLPVIYYWQRKYRTPAKNIEHA